MIAKLIWCVLFIGLFVLVNEYVREPWMDEIFHVPQTLQYIRDHDFVTWDPKITTPPGLYYVGYAFSNYFGDDLKSLRLVNLLAILLMLLTQPTEIASFPLLAFYANLYYTDVWSALLVTTALNRDNPADLVSTLLFAASLFFRQTNIIWLALAAAFSVLGEDGGCLDPAVLVRRSVTVVNPFVYLVGVLSMAFVYFNEGITLGDKSNHEVAIHGAQLLYFLLFLGLFSAPLAARWFFNDGLKLRHMQLAPAEVAAIWYIIQYGTVVHPFILADNRHYTFYIWRRIVTPHGGLLVLPLYWLAWRWFASTLEFRKLRTWVFLGALVAVLVPTPLMEPRYYIVPYIVWRRFFCRQKCTKLELVWNAALLIVTTGVFALSKTHFMW